MRFLVRPNVWGADGDGLVIKSPLGDVTLTVRRRSMPTISKDDIRRRAS